MNFKLQESINAADAWMKQVDYNRKHLDGLPMVGGPGTSIVEAIDPTAALQLKKESKKPIIFYGWQYKNETPVDVVPEEHDEESFQIRKNRIVNDYNKLYADKPKANRYAKESDFIFYVLYNRIDESKRRKKRHGIDSINYNAGNVEHNLKMFNMMNNPAEAIDVNPISGPFGTGLSEDINTFDNKGRNNMLNNELRDYVLELVLAEYETGHILVDDFDSFRSFKRIAADDGYRATRGMFDFYVECRDLGPSGFYEEYKDELDFSEDFIREYAIDSDYKTEEMITEESNMDKLRRLYPELNESGDTIVEDTLNEGPISWFRDRKEAKAAKSDPALAKKRRDAANNAKVDEFIKKLGVILSPAYSDKCEDCRFLVNGKWYDQEGYERIADPNVISNLLQNKKILTSDPDSKDIKTLVAAIDTVIVTSEGKIIRRGLEDLSSKPITYIRGRTDLTDINPKLSSKIITDRLLPAIEKAQEEAKVDPETAETSPKQDSEETAPAEEVKNDTTPVEDKVETPAADNTTSESPSTNASEENAEEEAKDTTDAEANKEENKTEESPNQNSTETQDAKETSTSEEAPAAEEASTATEEKPAANWLNDNAVKYGVRAIVGNRKDKRLLVKNETGHLTPIAPKDITLADIDKVFVDKDGKISLRTALEKVKSEYRNKKADIIKKAAVFGEDYDDSMEYEDFLTEDVFDDYDSDMMYEEETVDMEEITEDFNSTNPCDLTTMTYSELISGLVNNVEDSIMDGMIEELQSIAKIYQIQPEELVIVVDEYDDLNPDFLSKVDNIGKHSRFINKYRCGDLEFYADTRTPALIYFKSDEDAMKYCTTCVEENI